MYSYLLAEYSDDAETEIRSTHTDFNDLKWRSQKFFSFFLFSKTWLHFLYVRVLKVKYLY